MNRVHYKRLDPKAIRLLYGGYHSMPYHVANAHPSVIQHAFSTHKRNKVIMDEIEQEGAFYNTMVVIMVAL
jgi:hypothetical protein